MPFEQLCRRANTRGLAVRGAFHPEPGEFDDAMPGMHAATVVLFGFTGGEQWPFFAQSPEARDGLPHPLDRWSRRTVGKLAREFGARDFYPSGSPEAPPPFQRLAARCEPVHSSPIGFLIHPTWGLWHAYRGGMVLAERLELPGVPRPASPCASCAARPCLSSCPVQAFKVGSYDVASCAAHVASPAGRACREEGCLARRACPVGTERRYGLDQAQFHMKAFLRSF
jgi:hypothetical protein